MFSLKRELEYSVKQNNNNWVVFFSHFYCSYELYGVITHTGLTLSHGHYVAFVKAEEIRRIRDENVKNTDDVTTESCDVPKLTPQKEKRGDFDEEMGESQEFEGEQQEAVRSCQLEDIDETPPTLTKRPTPQKTRDSNPDTCDVTSRQNGTQQQVSSKVLEVPDDIAWCEFDDDRIALLHQNEFDKIIAPDSSNTPYMLFYKKVVRNPKQLQIQLLESSPRFGGRIYHKDV